MFVPTSRTEETLLRGPPEEEMSQADAHDMSDYSGHHCKKFPVFQGPTCRKSITNNRIVLRVAVSFFWYLRRSKVTRDVFSASAQSVLSASEFLEMDSETYALPSAIT
eukprot:2441525-Rhodomonas_salina.1